MYRSVLRLASKGALAAALVMTLGGVTQAADNGPVVMTSPSKDAAVLAKLPGLVNNKKAKTLSGLNRTINDGVVIRQSSIKDGKIIIPAGGLYTTARSANWLPFDAEPITIAGKMFYVITDKYVRDVVRDVTFKKNEIVPINANKTRGMQLTLIEADAYGIEGAGSAEFKLVKTTGNFYGSTFPVYTGPMIANSSDGSMVNGSKEAVGHTVPTAENGLSEAIRASNIASVGRTYVIVDSIAADKVRVREMATDSCTDIYVSPNAPIVGSYGVGESFKAGNATVTVTAIDKKNGAVTVKLTDPKGTLTKTFAPKNAETMKWMPMSMTARDQFWTMSKDNTVSVNLNIKEAAPVSGDKVALVAYTDVQVIKDGSVWEVDERFLARPET